MQVEGRMYTIPRIPTPMLDRPLQPMLRYATSEWVVHLTRYHLTEAEANAEAEQEDGAGSFPIVSTAPWGKVEGGGEGVYCQPSDVLRRLINYCSISIEIWWRSWIAWKSCIVHRSGAPYGRLRSPLSSIATVGAKIPFILPYESPD